MMRKWRNYGSNQQFLALIVSFTPNSLPLGDPGAFKEQCTIFIFYKKGKDVNYKESLQEKFR